MKPTRNIPRFLTLTLAFILSYSIATANPRGKPPKKDDDKPDIVQADPKAAAAREAELLTDVRQLTFEGRRAGEGYFSRDGGRMVFQSEREPGNPFFQIYLLDFSTTTEYTSGKD